MLSRALRRYGVTLWVRRSTGYKALFSELWLQVSEYTDKLKPYVEWISKIFTLAHDWTAPVDTLKRHQICELYTNGYDRLAEEVCCIFMTKSLKLLSQDEIKLDDIRRKFQRYTIRVTWVRSEGVKNKNMRKIEKNE